MNTDELLKRIPEKLMILEEYFQLNQTQMAEKMNEFPQNISNWIKKNDLPLSKYLEICQTLGINPGSLLNKEPATQELDPRIVRIMKNVSKLIEFIRRFR